MSALTIAIQTLLAGPGVVTICGNRIFPVVIPQRSPNPAIVVHLIYQAEEELLAGASQWPEARISVECRGNDAPTADRLGEAVIDWLRDKLLYLIEGCEVTFFKEGTDETDASENSDQGVPYVVRRIIDFRVRYRKV